MQPEAARPPSPSIGPLIETVKSNQLPCDGVKGRRAAIGDCELLASFNWIGKEKAPTIMVPGLPPVWEPLSQPVQLREDDGEYFRDQNAARFPDHPMEPAVRALLAQRAAFETSDVDIVGCGSTLGSLSRFVRGEHKPFRFTVELVGDTVFFIRRENTPDERIVGVRGYGHTFPDAYTKWHREVNGSESHQRLIRYSFAGLSCVVRFEGDGYLKHLADAADQDSELAELPELSALRMQKGGRTIPQQAIFDLKTRSVMRQGEDVLTEELPRLWISQIPNFVLAFHTRGMFHNEDISVRDVRKEIDAWEKKNQDALCRLGALLHKIVDSVKDTPDGKCEVRCREAGVLEIRQQLADAPGALSPALHKIWTRSHPPSPQESDNGAALSGARQESSDDEDSGDGVDLAAFSDQESEKDFTACSDACGYCGRC
ncbi:hypothetical protein LTR53_005068 [Teratosphaeriaceae sp. CCFEE 6253]|nr:hypothetical protein LTR53_005068 [Teratosphaeriaceae sp. CCFEE 6253]